MGLPDEIKDIRRTSLLTQTEFAKELGVSFATVNRWETGKAHPTCKAMKSIREFCSNHGIDCTQCVEMWKEPNE